MNSVRWLLAVAFMMVPGLRASTYPPLKDAQGLRERFATDSTAADFIFVVNTSSGLSDAGVFAEFRTQLPQLVDALSPRDNLILIGFNEKVTTIVSACPVGENTQPYQSAIFRMHDPRGRAGDLRAGLGAAMQALDRPERAPLQFLFFLLDSDVATQRQAKPTPDSVNWEALSKLHTEWEGGSIAEIYGLVVGDPSELQIIRMVFPEIRFVETSVVSLRGFFERWRSELPARKLRLQLSHEVAGNILTVQPIGRLKFTNRQTSAQLTVRVRSRLRTLSLTLPYAGEWKVFPDWLKLVTRYEDFPVTLAPGQSKDLAITISRDASENVWGCWHWQLREKELAQISYVPAVSLVDHAAIRNLGADLPTPYMNKIAIEIVRQHGQPAIVLWMAIGVLLLMLTSVVISRTYEVTGADFAVSFLKLQFAKIKQRFGKYIPPALTISEDVKLSLLWLFATPFILSMAFVVATVAIFLLAENWFGKIGLGVTGALLLGFWASVVIRQVRSFSDSPAAEISPRLSQPETALSPLANPSLDPVAEE